MESVRKNLRRCNWRRSLTYLLACFLIFNTSLPVVWAAPSGGVFTVPVIDPGTIVQGVPDSVVTVNQIESVIEWGEPGLGGIDTSPGESLTFLQADGLSNSAVLNRIMSGNQTQFDGVLNGLDMRIFIVNPAGIVFGMGSSVNVTQLVASAIGMSNDAFHNAVVDPTQDMVFDQGGDGIVHHYKGRIEAQSVYLVGKQVINGGEIIVEPGGLVVMAAGDSVYLAQDGSSVVVEVSGLGGTTADVQNRSIVSVPDGTIVLAAGDTFSRAIENVGILSARSGTVTAQAASIVNSGKIGVEAESDEDGDGGSVSLTGIDNVTLNPYAYKSIVANAGENGEGGDITITSEGTVTVNDGAIIEALGGSDSGNGGTVEISCENFILAGDSIMANAGDSGEGGDITITSEGTVTVNDGAIIEACGGSDSGNGGTIKISCEDFTLAGDVDASPGNKDYEPGVLHIDPANITIKNGENLGELNTLYEEDIEALSDEGTSLIVEADDSITIQDINDGAITGRFGNIELLATGLDSIVSFDDVSDIIRTTLGDITIEAGSGGIIAGSLETAKDLSDIKPTPGQITLTTTNGGDITAENLTIKSGWGHAEINVDASGNLTINGDVIVGRDAYIHNVPNGQNAEAIVNLSAGENVVLNGDNIGAYAHGIDDDVVEGDITKAYIGISSGTTLGSFGTTTIEGDLVARAKSSSQGTSEATIEITTWGEVDWGIFADPPLADGDEGQVHVESYETEIDENLEGDVAQVIITEQTIPELEGIPDIADTHMGDLLVQEVSVLTNDVGVVTVDSYTQPPAGEGSVVMNPDGTYTYTPEPGFVGETTFTYEATDGEGGYTGDVTVTITVTNDLPDVTDDAWGTHMGDPVSDNVLGNDTDTNLDPLTVVLDGTAPAHGDLVLNEDGSFTYEPDDGYVGDDSFTYEATDGELDEFGAPVVVIGTVTITMGNDPPTPVDDTATTTEGVPVSGNVLTNDTDPDLDPLTVVLNGTLPLYGDLVLNEDGSFIYTPDAGYVGDDSFTYEVTDGEIEGELVVATVTITVNPGEVPPPPPPPPPPTPDLPYLPAAPGLEIIEIEVSGCPALLTWAAGELGIDERMVEIWIANALASTRDIQPCDACARLRTAATILQDVDGTHLAALAQVINEFASSTAPPTEEQMASIADAIARNAEGDNQYALAGAYLDALAEYVGILNMDMNFSEEESVEFATSNYVGRLAEGENVGLAAYIAARLAELGG